MLRERQGFARRQDGKNEIRGGDLFLARGSHAGLARPRYGRFAAAGKRGEDAHAAAGQSFTDPGTHGAGGDDGDDRCH